MSQVPLKIALVGPSHPYKDGVAAHTTMLAHELSAAGHDVTLLSWARPDSLVRAARRLREVDLLIVVHVIPPLVPLHLTLLRAAGAGRRGSSGRGPRTVVIAHNVLPFEPHPGDAALVRILLSRVDAVLVHADEQARAARELDAEHVVVTDLPPLLPGGAPIGSTLHRGPARLLALGPVSRYTGIDVLLRAMQRVPGVSLTIAGEMRGEAGQEIRRLAEHHSLRGRVTIRSVDVSAEEIAPLLAGHDLLSLTYRSATASQNVLLAHAHGLAALASDVGTFGDQVSDGVDGYLVPPEDEDALVEVLTRLADPGEVGRIRAGVVPPDLHLPWTRYVEALEGLGTAGPPPARGRPRGGLLAGRADALVTRVRLARQSRRLRLDLAPTDFPAWLHPTDVLAHDDEAERTGEFAATLDLPRGDALADWAALGALQVLIRLQDEGRREALIIDTSGRGSPFVRWARAAGYAPAALELTGTRPSLSLLDVDAATIDLVTRLHPRDANASDIDETVTRAGWALRPGGLLCLTLSVGGIGWDAVGGAADLRAVVARAQDAGFVLVGDLDGDLTARLRHAARVSSEPDAAHALVRLTLRRR